MQTYYVDETGLDLPHDGDMLATTREDLIAWHADNDSNGCYTDADCEAEGVPLTTWDGLFSALCRVLRDDAVPAGCLVYRVWIHHRDARGPFQIAWTGIASTHDEAESMARAWYESNPEGGMDVDGYTIAAVGPFSDAY